MSAYNFFSKNVLDVVVSFELFDLKNNKFLVTARIKSFYPEGDPYWKEIDSFIISFEEKVSMKQVEEKAFRTYQRRTGLI